MLKHQYLQIATIFTAASPSKQTSLLSRMNEAIQLSVEAIDEISKYVKQSRVPDLQLSDFQSAREQNDMQALHAVRDYFKLLGHSNSP